MQIHLSADDGLPIYLQIVNQVTSQVASGRLAPGEELPPIRVLAQQLLLNPNTVARAYRELEDAGVVTKRRTAGTYVAEGGPKQARAGFLKMLTAHVDALLAEARQANVRLDEVLELVRRRHEATQPGKKETTNDGP
jgi:GntR family transcriptional regulator